MKMLVLGDFQGKFPFKLKRKIEKIKDEIDFIVGLGDYAGIDEWDICVNSKKVCSIGCI